MPFSCAGIYKDVWDSGIKTWICNDIGCKAAREHAADPSALECVGSGAGSRDRSTDRERRTESSENTKQNRGRKNAHGKENA